MLVRSRQKLRVAVADQQLPSFQYVPEDHRIQVTDMGGWYLISK
jgi:hypothetical protein